MAISHPVRTPGEAAPAGSPREFRTPLAVLDAMPAAVLVIDRRGQIRAANAAAGRAFGMSADGMVGHGVGDLLHPSSLGSLTGWAEIALTAGQFHADVRCQRVDHVVFEAELLATPMPAVTASGCYLMALTDVSEHRRLRRELVHYERIASMSRFVAGIAHELNNPLQVILGNVERLLAGDAPVGPTRTELLESMRDYSLRAADVVRSLLVFARQRSVTRTLVFPHAVIDTVLGRRADDLARERIDVRRDWDGTAAVMADGPMIEEVVTHLVVNALDAMRPRHGGRLTVGVRQQGRQVIVAIGDTGPGVAPGLRARIFEPFFTTKGPGQGTGLGLSICHGIVAEHGGTLAVDDDPDGGAVFSIELAAASLPGVDPFEIQ